MSVSFAPSTPRFGAPPNLSLAPQPVRFGDKKREDDYLDELHKLTPTGQMAIRQLYDVATGNPPPWHIFWSQALAGKYAELRDIVTTEFLSFQLKIAARQGGNETKFRKIHEKQTDFRRAAERLTLEPEPQGHSYPGAENIPEPEAKQHFADYRTWLQGEMAQRPGPEKDYGLTFFA